MIEKIDNYNPIGKNVNYENITNTLHKQIPKKSLLFLIGDFFNCENLNLKLLSKKHEVIVIIVRDKFEESPAIFRKCKFNRSKYFSSVLKVI